MQLGINHKFINVVFMDIILAPYIHNPVSLLTSFFKSHPFITPSKMPSSIAKSITPRPSNNLTSIEVNTGRIYLTHKSYGGITEL